jgi:Zn-finger nucleic acid-binding protein
MNDDDKPIEPRLVRIGRAYCPHCNRVGAVVRPADLEHIPCPRCGTICLSANGLDDLA